MDWRRRDCEVQVIPNLCEMNRLGCGTTTTDCHHHGLHHRTAASNTRAPPDVASSRLWWHGLCALECVCVMSEAWPGLWNIIYLVASTFTLMVCSSVAVVKITILNWMKYHGCDMHMMLRERVSPWVDHPECMSASMPCVIAEGLHARMCEWGVPVVISNKTTTSNSNDRRFPRHVTLCKQVTFCFGYMNDTLYKTDSKLIKFLQATLEMHVLTLSWCKRINKL